MRTLEVMAAVVGAALLISCSSPSDQAAPSATLSPAAVTEAPSPTPSPTETETEIETATVPDEIDAEYVQAVMDDLDAALGDTYRQVKRSGKAGEAYLARMHSLYTTDAASAQAGGFRRAVGVKGLAKQPANPTTDVLEILEVAPKQRPACIYFSATRDLNPMLRKKIDPVQPYYLVLQHDEPNEVNPTTWIMELDTFYRDGKPPKSACKGSS